MLEGTVEWYFVSHEFGPRKRKWVLENVYWTARLFWRDALFAFQKLVVTFSRVELFGIASSWSSLWRDL